MGRKLVLKRSSVGTPERRIPHRPAGALAPLSFGQEQIWLHAQLAPEAPLYTESLTIRRSGPLDPEALVASFGEMVRRHESWRTTFEWSGNQVLQRVQPDADLPIRVADLRHLRWDERERAALRLAGEDLDRRIDLSREPGVQALLVTLSDSDHRLYLCLHHLIFDGISIYRVFLPELAWLYDAKVTGAPCLLKEPPLQYGDFAFWERRSANEELLRRLAGYWRERLAGAPSTIELPADHPRPPRQSFRGGLVRLEFAEPLTAAARTIALREGCTLFMLLLASFAATLHRWSGQSDMLIGTVSGGRDHPELERVIGYFLRVLVIRTDLSGNPTFRELLGRIRETVLDALCHDGLPFQRMVRALAPARDLGRSPVFQVTFSIEPPLPPLRPRWDISEMDAGAVASKFDLSIELEDRGDVVHLRAIYSTDLFEFSTISRIMLSWRRLLGRAVTNPAQRLQELVGGDEELAPA